MIRKWFEMMNQIDLADLVRQWKRSLSHCEYAGELVIPEDNLPVLAAAIRRDLFSARRSSFTMTALFVLAINCMYYYHDEHGFWIHFCQLLEVSDDSQTQSWLGDMIENQLLHFGFQSIISGNELVQIKKRMIEAKEVKRKRGELPTNVNTLPFGVGYDREKVKYYYNDDIEKIKQLFHFFYFDGIRNFYELEKLTGMHHRTIANRLKNKLYIGYRYIDEKRSSEKIEKADGRQADRKKVKRGPDEIINVKVYGRRRLDRHRIWCGGASGTALR